MGAAFSVCRLEGGADVRGQRPRVAVREAATIQAAELSVTAMNSRVSSLRSPGLAATRGRSVPPRV